MHISLNPRPSQPDKQPEASAAGTSQASPGRGGGQKDAALPEAHDLDPAAFRRLVAQRGRALFLRGQQPLETEDERQDAEREIEQHFEAIGAGRDLLPAVFLERGAARSRAVCRIAAGSGYGTGFLVGAGLLMTSRQVIGAPSEAAAGEAQFELEYGQTPLAVALHPGRFFLTSQPLDFTIVACETEALAGIEPVPLFLDTAAVTRYERVSVIQCPENALKQLAIYGTRVIRVLDKTVHYRTLGAPAPAGAPVFNTQWDLVAIQRASWPEENGEAVIHEGVRIPAIVEYLFHRFGRSPQPGASIREALESALKVLPSTVFPGVREAHEKRFRS